MSNVKIHKSGHYAWNDRKWFIGHIVAYNFSCMECGENDSSIVHVKEHIDFLGAINFVSYDYCETLQGGISVYNDLFRWRINGSIHDVINLPDQKFLERCSRIATAFHTELVVTGCVMLSQNVRLYLTSQTSEKPWTFGPYETSASYASKL
jgi:hypothetical protein